MKKGGTGINLKLEAQIHGYRNQEQRAMRRAWLHWRWYVWSFERQLRDIREALEFNKSIGRFDRMLAGIIDCEPKELIRRTRQCIRTYAQIWKIDLQSGSLIHFPSFTSYDEIKEMKERLGAEMVERQKIESRDWTIEMQQRVQEHFVAILGEIMTNPQIPTIVQEKAKEIHEQFS